MRGAARRGSVMLVVAVTIIGVALVGTSVVVRARDGRARAYVSERRAESAAAVWSGVEVVRAAIGSQRVEQLGGATPELESAWVVYETARGERMVARLVAFEDGGLVRSEAARLNANRVGGGVLGEIEGLGESAGASIAGGVGEGYGSVGEVVRAAGVDAGAWADALTVHAYEPEVECGVDGDDRRGAERVSLSGEWTDELARRIDERWGEGAAESVRTIREQGNPLATRSDLVDVIEAFDVGRDGWGALFDAVGVAGDGYVVGRVDLTRASAAVLSALPGIDRASAEQIVSVREGLAERERRSIVWPVTQGILEITEFELALEHLTTRTLQWRVRVEAGFAVGDEGDPADAVLANASVFEVVIDAAQSPARVAYARDVTGERAWGAVSSRVAELGADAGEDPGTPDEVVAAGRVDSAVTTAGSGPGADSGVAKGVRVGRWFVAGGAP